MAALDPTQLASVRNVFPELSESQCLVALLFSSGFSVKEIAWQRQVSPSTIKNTLTSVKTKFDQPSIHGVRSVILLRLMLRDLMPEGHERRLTGN